MDKCICGHSEEKHRTGRCMAYIGSPWSGFRHCRCIDYKEDDDGR